MFFVQTLIDKIFALRYNKYTNYIIRRFSAMFIRPEIEFVETADVITTSQMPSLEDGGENKETNWNPWF